MIFLAHDLGNLRICGRDAVIGGRLTSFEEVLETHRGRELFPDGPDDGSIEELISQLLIVVSGDGVLVDLHALLPENSVDISLGVALLGYLRAAARAKGREDQEDSNGDVFFAGKMDALLSEERSNPFKPFGFVATLEPMMIAF